MDIFKLETDQLLLRNFVEKDLTALHLLLSDKEVNTFLPWFPVKTMEETKHFFETRLKGKKYCFAICLKEKDEPIGYITVAMDDSHDFGYALRKEFWHQGIVTQASKAVVHLLQKDGIDYITATHDKNNPRSGGVMRQIGMKYCYSYKELWQPKNILVTFRMYQLNLDGQTNRIYKKYWNLYADHFIETDV
ncbi:GNAT family N-acetyltransferase [uncultured Ruthenibacterium sp.]|uniref:GNAT family N-acetyltransferase n=1 Tax=uncultured Ruthenibacterium sp. TaxID=1905347 RepID=UPI00349E7DD8